MESSVASRNPFDLLSENPITESQQAKSSQKKQTKPSTKDNAAPRPGPQGTRYPARGGYRNVVHVDSSSDASFDRRRRGGPRSERGRGATRGGRRAFDRHSGTGLVDSEKKTTQGWLGKDNVTVADGEKAAEDAQKDSQDAAGAETPVENAVEEEEDNTLTLEQYYKERAAKLLSDTKEARKANQGVTIDASQLKESVTVSKEEEEFFSATAGSKARKNKQQKEKVHVAIEQRFNQQESRRGGRGGHRDNRFGPGSRRQNRSKPIDISSSADFPAL
ncbi:hypothetical protein H4219_003359 [Mycoemilia scoparia]|uniref:Hyaluronan/mRNA-binding protein domain-containing protein n=1 Tax=Mycoemilia scoparia TaxID=417184 RepID=A0A9W7ZYZ0_9FUNG|nr:hypothetical protein H4219_003359 [Mycoemilia scoparia]